MHFLSLNIVLEGKMLKNYQYSRTVGVAKFVDPQLKNSKFFFLALGTYYMPYIKMQGDCCQQPWREANCPPEPSKNS